MDCILHDGHVQARKKKHLNRVPDILRMHQQETWVPEVLHVR